MGKSNDSHEIENIDINPAVNGGFAVRCRYKAKKSTSAKTDIGGYVDPDQLAFGSKKELITWLDSTLPDGDVESESAGKPPATAPVSAESDVEADQA